MLVWRPAFISSVVADRWIVTGCFLFVTAQVRCAAKAKLHTCARLGGESKTATYHVQVLTL